MVSIEQRQKAAAGILILAGGFMAVFSWITFGGSGTLYVLMGMLLAGIGLAIWHGQNRQTAYTLIIAGILALLMGLGRAAIYTPTNGLAIALFVLGVVLLFRGYQYYQAAN